jgi:hypothetical protein
MVKLSLAHLEGFQKISVAYVLTVFGGYRIFGVPHVGLHVPFLGGLMICKGFVKSNPG